MWASAACSDVQQTWSVLLVAEAKAMLCSTHSTQRSPSECVCANYLHTHRSVTGTPGQVRAVRLTHVSASGQPCCLNNLSSRHSSFSGPLTTSNCRRHRAPQQPSQQRQHSHTAAARFRTKCLIISWQLQRQWQERRVLLLRLLSWRWLMQLLGRGCVQLLQVLMSWHLASCWLRLRQVRCCFSK